MRSVTDGARGDLLQRHRPHALVPVEGNHSVEAIIAEDEFPQLHRALVHESRHQRTTLAGRRLAHQDDLFVLPHACPYLALAIGRLEVRLRQEYQYDSGGLDVALDELEIIKVVYVQEDLHASDAEPQARLDLGALVLPVGPRVGEKQVPLASCRHLELRRTARVAHKELRAPRSELPIQSAATKQQAAQDADH
jgi:hypothetical protein